MYLWDSNILRCHKQGDENLLEHLQRVAIDEIALPSVVVAETLRGKCEYALKAEPVNIQFAHELLREALKELQGFKIVYFDHASAAVFTQLIKKHRTRKRYADVMIAAVAIAGDHVVVTRNQKHFADLLPKHQLQNWIDESPTG